MITIALPWKSPPLTLNQRPHWAVKNAQTQAIREVVALLANQLAVPAPIPPVKVVLVWTVTDRRRRDTDNPSLTTKACIDGLVDAGLLPADHWEVVADSHCEIRLGTAKGLALVISEVGAETRNALSSPQRRRVAIFAPSDVSPGAPNPPRATQPGFTKPKRGKK